MLSSLSSLPLSESEDDWAFLAAAFFLGAGSSELESEASEEEEETAFFLGAAFAGAAFLGGGTSLSELSESSDDD